MSDDGLDNVISFNPRGTMGSPTTPGDPAKIRTFSTGATRNTDENKLDYEGFLSPEVLRIFAIYMHRNRRQADGGWRDSDNWQKGIPKDAYMKSLWRHFHDMWIAHRRGGQGSPEQVEALCAMMFNVQGYLYELIQESNPRPGTEPGRVV